MSLLFNILSMRKKNTTDVVKSYTNQCMSMLQVFRPFLKVVSIEGLHIEVLTGELH